MSVLTAKVQGIRIVQDEANFRYFKIEIEGPVDSLYEGGLFKAELYLTNDYPMTAPKVLFKSNIYHPNIDRMGKFLPTRKVSIYRTGNLTF